MKNFVLVTKSESGDDYTYFIKHPEMPTTEEINTFLVEHGSDVEDGESFEEVITLQEITEMITLDGQETELYPTDEEADAAAEEMLQNAEGVDWDDLVGYFMSGVDYCKNFLRK